MAKGIIISGKERILRPWISFILSLFITGAGEIYSGSPQRGIILALIRIFTILIIPFYSALKDSQSHIDGIFISIVAALFVTFISPLNAFFASLGTKRIIIRKQNSVGIISIFGVSSLLLLFLSLTIFFSIFSIIRIDDDAPPLISGDDFIVIKKLPDNFYKKGDLVLLSSNRRLPARIIAEPEDDVLFDKGRFTVQGSDFSYSIFTDSELNFFSIINYDVISESCGIIRYPVINASGQHKLSIHLSKDEYYTVPDDRKNSQAFTVVKKHDITGRVEGILFSFRRPVLIIKPYLPAQ